MEIASEENWKLVSRVFMEASEALGENRRITNEQHLIYCVELLSSEVNSGASFEQYFRWARIEDIAKIVSQLEGFGLTEAAEIAHEAISVAYPDGLPPIPADKKELASWSGSEAQHARLRELAEKFTDYNGMIMNRLADYARITEV